MNIIAYIHKSFSLAEVKYVKNIKCFRDAKSTFQAYDNQYF